MVIGKKFLRALREESAESAPQPIASNEPVTPTRPALPQHLSDRVLGSKAVLEGERKQVTILFADIKGSTELIEFMDAEEADRLLRVALDAMMAAVHRYEGTVNRIMGDGIMAILGAPLAHEDHAVRACYAALAMQAAIRSQAENTRQTFGVELELRCGMNSGDVVVRAVHNDLTMDYDAIGATVHLAARMEQMALGGTSRLTATTMRLAEGYVEAKSLGAVPVKGISDPLEVFELHGAVDIRSRFQASQRRGLSRFVGRDAEMAQVARALKLAAAGEGRGLSLVGEAGVGKSRLCFEMGNLPEAEGFLLLSSGSVSHAKAAAFLPLLDLLRDYFQLARNSDERQIRERVMGKLLAMDEGLRDISAPILALFGLDPREQEWEEMDPARKRRRTLDACRALLLNEAQVQPLIVLFEDLHWIDSETQAFLDLLVDSLVGAPIFFLVNYRPEYQDSWLGKGHFTHIRLSPLEQQSGEALLVDLLGDGADMAPLRQMILTRTEGNPFFVEESVQALVEDGTLTGAPGDYRLTVPVRAISVPATVQTVLASRIDRLDPDDKHLLQTAAVIGKDFGLPLLQKVMATDSSNLRSGLDRLQQAEFIYETRVFPEPEFTFKHALTHQVTYEGQLQDRRRELHANILGAWEKLNPDGAGGLLERFAHHALQGELWEKAHDYATQAAKASQAVNANRSARESVEMAIEALSQLPETDERLMASVDLRFALRDILFVIGEADPIFALMEQAEVLASKLEDQGRLIEVLLYQSGFHWSAGRYSSHALGLARRAYELAEASQDKLLIGVSCYRMITSLVMSGQYLEAIPWGERGTEALRDVERTFQRFGGMQHGFISSFLAIALAETGQLDRAETVAQRAFDVAVSEDHAYSITVTGFGLAHCLLLREKVEQVLPAINLALETLLAHEVEASAPWVAGRAAFAFALAAQWEEVDMAADMVLSKSALTPSMRHSFANAWAARAYLLNNDTNRARAVLDGIIRIEDEEIDPVVEAWIEMLWGQIKGLEGDSDGAVGHLEECLIRAQELNLTVLFALCHEQLWKLTSRQDCYEAASKAASDLGYEALQKRLVTSC